MDRPRIEIEYCARCGFLLRAAWLAQELLSSFRERLAAVTLLPGSGGIFDVRLDGEVLHSKWESAEFPEPRVLKRAIRDRIAPDMRIGHEPGPEADQ